MTPFEEILNKSLEIHKKKREDYTTNPDSNPYENFTRANEIVNWFPSEYASFASHIGTKLARLGSLLQRGRQPNNESLDDSFLDLVTYCGLMYGFYKSRLPTHIPETKNETPKPEFWAKYPTCPKCSEEIRLGQQHTSYHGVSYHTGCVRELNTEAKQEIQAHPIYNQLKKAYHDSLDPTEPITKPCAHTYLNLNRRCNQCSRTIGWAEITDRYWLDQDRDQYAKT